MALLAEGGGGAAAEELSTSPVTSRLGLPPLGAALRRNLRLPPLFRTSELGRLRLGITRAQLSGRRGASQRLLCARILAGARQTTRPASSAAGSS